MKKTLLFITFLSLNFSTYAQVYMLEQTRHRFAQMNLGIDYQTSFGGTMTYKNTQNEFVSSHLPNAQSARFLIGGTHFWGHADFYVAIPIFVSTNNIEATTETVFSKYSSGVETVFKYYPWRIEHRKFRPFLGVSLAPFSFQQGQKDAPFLTGAIQSNVSLPLLTGFSFETNNHLLELSLLYHYNNEMDYYISTVDIATIQTPPIYTALSYRYMFETTLSAEASWQSGETTIITKKLAEKGKLNSFFVGAGMSSAWLLGNSDYNRNNRPFIPTYDNAVMPDITIGYYLHNPDINIAVNYRGYTQNVAAYGVTQSVRRRSIGLEVTKGLVDYHGFVPFIGPIISYENLHFSELIPIRSAPLEFQDNQLGYGVTLGWDIRPNRLNWFVLRTNLRYFPDLKLQTTDSNINFNNIEFNFIQMVVFLNRIT